MTAALDVLAQALEKAKALGADTADAVMFETASVSAARRMGKPEGLERAEEKALGLRAFIGKKQAVVSTSDTGGAAIAELAERAVAMARLAPEDPDIAIAPASLMAKDIPALDLHDKAEPDISWLSAQCEEAEDAAMAVQGITNSEGAEASYSKSRISLAIANGGGVPFSRSYDTSYLSLSVSVLAGSSTGMERDYDFTSSRHRADLKKPAAIGKEASKRALKRLNPRKAKSCKAAVVFDPRVSRQLVGILAGAISGSSISRGASFLKDALGKEIFAENIRIIDDPHIRRGLGSRPFDAEGVKNGRRVIVDGGVLSTWLLDLRTAHKLGMETTGHASRGVASAPSPSATNLYMEKGTLTPQALIKDIESGLYVTETFGMGVNIVTGDYSQGASGFWIENGEIAYPVSEITIAGHLQAMFKNLTPANDLEFRYATNAPTLRVEGMTIAGA